MKGIPLICTGLTLSVCAPVWADQPVFNEMPRWDNGWGIQIVEEYRRERHLKLRDKVVFSGFSEDVHITHIEGVYTWDKSIRLTAKLPYVQKAQRELPRAGGGKIVQTDEGFGDLTLALPLKEYFNLHGRSGSWTVSPQVRVPLGAKDEYNVYSHDWGAGLSLGYETETYNWIFSTGLSLWHFEGDKPSEASVSLDLALNLHAFNSSGHLRWENDWKFKEDDSILWKSGPSLYWRFSDLIHAKVSWKFDLIDRKGSLDHGDGTAITAGIAFVF